MHHEPHDGLKELSETKQLHSMWILPRSTNTHFFLFNLLGAMAKAGPLISSAWQDWSRDAARILGLGWFSHAN